MALRLAKAGYYGGDPERVLETRVDLVMAAVQYLNFLSDWERTWYELNRKESR